MSQNARTSSTMESMRRQRAASERGARFGQTELSVLRVPSGGTPVRKICRPDEMAVEVVVPVGGTIMVRPESRDERAVRAGEALYLIGCRRYAAYALRGASAVTLGLPFSAVDEYIDRSSTSPVLVQNSAVLQPATSFLGTLLEGGDELDRLSSYFAEKLIWEMVASVYLEGKGVGAAEAPNTGILDRAMAQIAAYRTDRSLTPEAVARSLNVSMRQLQRVFSATGSTPSREIRRQRAELAVSMLRSESFGVLNVTQIAHHSGFSDAAELRRALVAFGYPSPRELRAGLPTTR